jgi:hypothetical protein
MRAPLRFHLATAFLALVGVVGVATLVHTYYASSRLLLAASDEEFTHIARETREHVAGLFEPAPLQLDLLARHPVAEAASAAARLAELPVLAAALAANPDLAAIRIGYENGESFSVRRTAQGPVAEKGGRDPRLEPWYYRAPGSGEIVRTDLYAQPVTGDLAMTFSRRTGSGHGVVGVDIALGELSARLREHRVTPGSQIALADADGHVVGHPDTERLRRSDAAGGERRRLVSVFDLGQEPLAEVYVESHGRDRRSLLSLEGGRQWIGESRAVGADWGAPILVLLAVPRDEILVGARKVAGEQLTVGLVALALALPLVWLLARAVAAARAARRGSARDPRVRLRPPRAGPLAHHRSRRARARPTRCAPQSASFSTTAPHSPRRRAHLAAHAG